MSCSGRRATAGFGWSAVGIARRSLARCAGRANMRWPTCSAICRKRYRSGSPLPLTTSMMAPLTAMLCGVVKDDAEREARARAQSADAVAHRHPVEAARAANRTVVDREDHRIALLQRHDLAFRLTARALLDEQKLAAGEI